VYGDVLDVRIETRQVLGKSARRSYIVVMHVAMPDSCCEQGKGANSQGLHSCTT
jgi:hypothetical protein